MSTRSVRYGAETISFELLRSDRATLEITVSPDGGVTVKAPTAAEDATVLARVVRRGRWIIKQQRYFAQFEPRTPPRRYVGGETHLYMGRQYRLAIAPGEVGGVRLVGGWFRVSVPELGSPIDHDDDDDGGNHEAESAKSLLDEWYATKTHRRLNERFESCWERFPVEGIARPKLQLRRMRTRWGSMSPNGTLSLSPDLVRAPRECIDYVILHELCHLAHADHGSEFHALLERVVPDWERRKHRLEITLA